MGAYFYVGFLVLLLLLQSERSCGDQRLDAANWGSLLGKEATKHCSESHRGLLS